MLVRDKFDLYLGSSLGRWTLLNSKPANVASVKTVDPDLEHLALSLGFNLTAEITSEYGISIHWPRMFSRNYIDKYNTLLNIHPGIVPQSRGMYPVFWNTYFNQPAGASCHKITAELDLGPVYRISPVVSSENQTAGEIWQLVNREEELMVAEILTVEPKLICENLREPSGLIGPKKTMLEFKKMKYSPDLESMSNYEIYRLMLAVTHKDFDRPGWVNRYLQNELTPLQWLESVS
jgi:hypothetical protein